MLPCSTCLPTDQFGGLSRRRCVDTVAKQRDTELVTQAGEITNLLNRTQGGSKVWFMSWAARHGAVVHSIIVVSALTCPRISTPSDLHAMAPTLRWVTDAQARPGLALNLELVRSTGFASSCRVLHTCRLGASPGRLLPTICYLPELHACLSAAVH